MPSMDERRGFPSVSLRTHRPWQVNTEENVRYTTTSQRAMPAQARQTQIRRPVNQPVDDLNGYPLEEDDQYYTSLPAIPKSARRYVDKYGRETRQQGNQRLVIDKAPRRIRLHGFFYAGIGMLLALILWQGLTMAGTAWSAYQLNIQYGMPRTFQVDMNVGHGKGKSHFIFENLNGHIFFEEIEMDDMAHSHIYTVTTLYGPNASSVPVTADFVDFNHDGRVDIKLLVGTDGATILYQNTGTGFQEVSQ